MPLIDWWNLVKYQTPPVCLDKNISIQNSILLLELKTHFLQVSVGCSPSLNPKTTAFHRPCGETLYFSTNCHFNSISSLFAAIPAPSAKIWVCHLGFFPNVNTSSIHPNQQFSKRFASFEASDTKASLPLRYSANRQEGTAGRSTERSVAKSLGAGAWDRNIPNSLEGFYVPESSE